MAASRNRADRSRQGEVGGRGWTGRLPAPVHPRALAGTAGAFEANPMPGSPGLGRRGLHLALRLGALPAVRAYGRASAFPPWPGGLLPPLPGRIHAIQAFRVVQHLPGRFGRRGGGWRWVGARSRAPPLRTVQA